jgi:hypothetical protein
MNLKKEFKHEEGIIEVTHSTNNITIDPKEKDDVINVKKDQSKESIIEEIKEKLTLIYTDSPSIVKDFITWLEEVL